MECLAPSGRFTDLTGAKNQFGREHRSDSLFSVSVIHEQEMWFSDDIVGELLYGLR